MKFYSHRINTIQLLIETSKEYGVEVDVRSNGKELYIHHDAFGEGELFEDWLVHYRHNGLILNTKCEGMEEALMEMMEKRGIEDYFFLDLSLPFLIKYAKRGLKNIAVRYSAFEPLDFVKKFKGMVDWVWVDCFNGIPINPQEIEELNAYFRVCLVSPELQGSELSKVQEFKKLYSSLTIDAVCTKRPDLWV